MTYIAIFLSVLKTYRSFFRMHCVCKCCMCCQLIDVTVITRTVAMAGACWQELSVCPVLLTLAVDISGLSGVTATMIVLMSRTRLAATLPPASTSLQQLQPVSYVLHSDFQQLCHIFRGENLPLVLWHCWLGVGRASGCKNWVIRCWHGYPSGVKGLELLIAMLTRRLVCLVNK